MLKQKHYWLFDMDGTLTRAMHDFDAMRAELALPPGQPILEALAELAPELAEEKHRQLDEMELRMASDAVAQPGSRALLSHLSAAGAQLGIVTRNGREIADVTLEAAGLSEFFTVDTIVSRDCCAPKPDPAGVELLLNRWSANAAQSVMVGDYLFDLQAGRAAGLTTVQLDTSGEFAWPDITDVCVQSLPELHALLN
ncbi:MAG: HAD family hydrolase [Granulosicoccus sp.]|nr:HAD family hydrolase [Granulosicoccus sp.]